MLPIPLGQSCSWDPELIEAGAKHYVGYGAAIGGRDYNSAYIPENQLRNVFLPPFHAAVEAGAGTFMSAFNDVNGVPATGNRFTLQTILRDEWGFAGFVVSDRESVTEMIVHGYCADEREAIVNQPELICFLRERPDVCACIDVTEPEPPKADCPLFDLPNVVLTPHLAGSMGNECRRIGQFICNGIDRYLAGRPLEGEITRELAATLA